MKFLRFSFCHPVIVNAHLIPVNETGIRCLHFGIATDESNLLSIPIDQCTDGNWRIEMEWEYGNESFHHKKEFEIKRNKLF